MLTCTCCVAGEQVGAATDDNTLGADSTVKMVTIGQEQLHKAGQGQVPPGRRICNGRAGRRCRQCLSLCAGCNALHLGCARLDQRAFRPPAAVCYGTCLAGHLKEVLRCSWLVLDRVWCQIVVILVILCVRHNKRCSYGRFECWATFGGAYWECPIAINIKQS